MFRVEAERIVAIYVEFTDEELSELWEMALNHNDFLRLQQIALVRRWREGKYK